MTVKQSPLDSQTSIALEATALWIELITPGNRIKLISNSSWFFNKSKACVYPVKPSDAVCGLSPCEPAVAISS